MVGSPHGISGILAFCNVMLCSVTIAGERRNWGMKNGKMVWTALNVGPFVVWKRRSVRHFFTHTVTSFLLLWKYEIRHLTLKFDILQITSKQQKILSVSKGSFFYTGFTWSSCAKKWKNASSVLLQFIFFVFQHVCIIKNRGIDSICYQIIPAQHYLNNLITFIAKIIKILEDSLNHGHPIN